jgi:hypothetical protein
MSAVTNDVYTDGGRERTILPSPAIRGQHVSGCTPLGYETCRSSG